jgi:oxygen-independent coproporphyrinogen-3 oxidase
MASPAPQDAVEIRLMGETFWLTGELLERYNTHGPRYTSYPTAPMWSDAFDEPVYRAAIQETNAPEAPATPLSLYVHLPFCESRCLFCGCNVVITRQKERSEAYLDYLFKEMRETARLMNTQRSVVQLHWGGGTPTYLSPDQMTRLFRFQQETFSIAETAEIAIEVDPRVTTPEQIELLRTLGFNRISLGVQDFDPKVQETIHRVQPMEMTEAMIRQCRDLGFESLNLDLIYGLPYQTVETFQRTVEEVIRMSPDRIALYNYAHVPWMAPHQAHMPESALPSGPEKLRIFQHAIHRLTEAGYVYIGMDHFAKPEDELTRAQQAGNLHRNFMGYTVQTAGQTAGQAGSDLYGFGVSAISGLHGHYAQNQRTITDYYAALDADRLPTMRGIALSAEDRLRRTVINQILCLGRVDFQEIEGAFALPSFTAHFADALEKLAGPMADHLMRLEEKGLYLTPLGRILSRNIAMAFDAYLGNTPQPASASPLFSKTL